MTDKRRFYLHQVLVLLSTSFAVVIYGYNILIVNFMLASLDLFQQQPLNILHIIGYLF